MHAMTQLCTFYLGPAFYAIEVTRVIEVVRPQAMTCVPLAPAGIRGLINLRGSIVTAIDLRARLQLPLRTPEDTFMNVVVRGHDGEIVSLLVDSVGDVMDLSESQFEPPPETLQGSQRELIVGAYKLENGLLLLLNVDRAINFGGEIRSRGV